MKGGVAPPCALAVTTESTRLSTLADRIFKARARLFCARVGVTGQPGLARARSLHKDSDPIGVLLGANYFSCIICYSCWLHASIL